MLNSTSVIIKLTQLLWLTCFVGNSQDDCFPQTESDIEKAGFESYFQFAWVLILIIIGMCIALHFVACFRKEYNKRSIHLDSTPQAIDIEKENNHALDIIGRDSIYRFFLSKDPLGWSLALAAVAAQLWMCYLFIIGSEYDFSGRRDTDLMYTWMCPRDKEPCWDDNGMVEMFAFICACSLCVLSS